MASTLPTPVLALIEATNDGDADAFLDSFTPAGVVDDWGREFIGKQVTLSVLDFTSTDSETTLAARVGGNGYNGPSTFTFFLDGNALSRMNIRA